ncbi:MAG: DNA replication and repair protein RecF [Candidatus Doudnabacteria bacterium]|nr:DNA replication and repair protein RecF [Candidatus Doudnabacteria bacterium]
MIRRVKFENFRNYKKAEAEIRSDLVLILGKNGSGKTNFLESLFYLSNLYSFRAPDLALVKTEETFFALEAEDDRHRFEVVVETVPRVRRGNKIDGVKTKRTAWNSFGSVLFIPNDLNLFILGPGARRSFLNQTIVQKDKIYASSLAGLDHVLKQKTALLNDILAGKENPGALDFWNEQLCELSTVITEARRGFLDFFRIRFAEVYAKLTGFDNIFGIEYKSQPISLEILKAHEQAEIGSGSCLIGPHRDDFVIKKDGQLNIYNSSRGELRSQILTMKLLEAEFLAGRDKPVILLDDVFSELDEIRRAKLIENLSGSQIFITSTEEHHLPKLASSAQIFKVEDNGII